MAASTRKTDTTEPVVHTGLARLRDPFPPTKIGKLPQSTIANADYKALPKAHCNICSGYHPATSTIHLDFIGHADVTDRLLEVDPEWTWEPMGHDDLGLPMVVTHEGSLALWIKLTVLGVTRPGVGTVAAGARDAEKQLIGDALRNAAMRFGVGLDLWQKEYGDTPGDTTPTENGQPTTNSAAPPPARAAGRSTPVFRLPLKVTMGDVIGPRLCPECSVGQVEGLLWESGRVQMGCMRWREGCKYRVEAPIPVGVEVRKEAEKAGKFATQTAAGDQADIPF